IRRQDIFSVASAPDGSLLAGTTGRGIFRTTDSGYRWNRMTGAGIPYYFYAFCNSGERIFAGTEKGLFASDDNGVTWSLLTADLNPGTGDLPVYGVLRDTAGDLFIGTGAGIFNSRDDGATWNPAGLGASTIRGLALTNDNVLYAATGSEGIFSSSDGGNQWTPKGLIRSDIQTVAVSGAGHVFVGVYSGIYLSTDAGLTWTQKNFTYGHVHSLLFNGSFNVYAASSSGLYVSSDGGERWAFAGLSGRFVVALAYDGFHRMVAGIYKGGVAQTSGIITGISDGPGLPSSPSLAQNYPNPFNPATTIDYAVPALSHVTLRVYDLLGRVAGTLVSGRVPPGSYRATWNGGEHPSGVYFYAITIVPGDAGGSAAPAGPWTQIRKMLLVK
ncbi:MAG TPA: T9SS type A sorting domain-containing protein, partial [Bacteroidota bacterium]|nr:T9SS type A sorting domain-containing protein [Bacteroidota bacterium]